MLSEREQPITVITVATAPCESLSSLREGTVDAARSAGMYFQPQPGGRPRGEPCQLPEGGVVPAFVLTLAAPDTVCDEPVPSLAGLNDFIGPVSALAFFADRESTQDVISAEAARWLYAVGGTAGIAPWTNDDTLFAKPKSSVSRLMARALEIPFDRFRSNYDALGHGIISEVNKAAASGFAEATLAFEETLLIETALDKVKVLAYQQVEQNWGYFPNATSDTTFEKINVREGRYWLWHTPHLFTRASPESQLVDELVQLFRDDVEGPKDPSVIQSLSWSGLVPRCAMRVYRDGDFGELYGYAPTHPCGCFFESLVNYSEDLTGCQACLSDQDCTEPGLACHYGFCE